MARVRRFHLDMPPVTADVAGHRVSFVGATFHARSVMIEYDVDPPMDRTGHSFGPKLLSLVVTDDVDSTPYPTRWEDFDWSFLRPGRMTTRLDRRPAPDVTRMSVSVRIPRRVTEPNGFDHLTASDEELVAFDIDLPADHASRHSHPVDQRQGASTGTRPCRVSGTRSARC